MKQKAFVDEDGNISTAEVPDGVEARIDPPAGKEGYEVTITSDSQFKDLQKRAKKGQQMKKKELDEVKDGSRP